MGELLSLVRLSHHNIEANAKSIEAYLGIDSDERAITSLPFHYSYGLSVLNSHLCAGASLVLTERSIVDDSFWHSFRSYSATSMAGVPHTYELFERLRLRDNPPQSLRTLTQAGGRLSPRLVEAYARFGADHDVRFFAMYGQTEATARMSYLPPECAVLNPDSIGIPIPGGAFGLIDNEGRMIEADEMEGELVYQGPNVMMGYAEKLEDLARGSELAELRTGDLAKRGTDGLFRIVGRVSRFSKIAGLRVGFDDVEAILDASGIQAAVTGNDQHLALCVSGERSADDARELVALRCRLPITSVVAYNAPDPPMLPSGKVDYPAIRRRAAEIAILGASDGASSDVRLALSKALGRPVPSNDSSFASLGGDSLSYIEASMGIERALGTLPMGWESLTVAELEVMRPLPTRNVARGSVSVSTEIIVRVAALALVIAGHAASAQTEFLRGGALILFILAGYNLARFQKISLLVGHVWGAISGSIYRVILPYFALMLVILPASGAENSVAWPLLVSTFFVEIRGPLFAFWFIEAVFHSLLIVTGLMLISPVRRFANANPFTSGLALVGLAIALKICVPMIWSDPFKNSLSVDAWFYAYAIGWTMFSARTSFQRFLIAVLAILLTGLDWGFGAPRNVWPAIAIALILWMPSLRLPRSIAPQLMVIASDSYFIYLVHVLAVHFLIFKLNMPGGPLVHISVVLMAASVIGIAYARAWRFVVPRLIKLTDSYQPSLAILLRNSDKSSPT